MRPLVTLTPVVVGNKQQNQHLTRVSSESSSNSIVDGNVGNFRTGATPTGGHSNAVPINVSTTTITNSNGNTAAPLSSSSSLSNGNTNYSEKTKCWVHENALNAIGYSVNNHNSSSGNNNKPVKKTWQQQKKASAIGGSNNSNNTGNSGTSSSIVSKLATPSSFVKQQQSSSLKQQSFGTQTTATDNISDGSSITSCTGPGDSHSGLTGSMLLPPSPTTALLQQRKGWCYHEGVLEKQCSACVTVVLTATGDRIDLPADSISTHSVVLGNDYNNYDSSGSDDNSNCIPPDDLISLTHLHEPSVVDALFQRYQHQHIYTGTGPVLLAVNPFCHVPKLYGDAVMHQYFNGSSSTVTAPTSSRRLQQNPKKSSPPTELPPHVYKIADGSFRSMMRALEDTTTIVTANDISSSSSTSSAGSGNPNNVNQSILVSGESGSGKTVTTKFVMKYLAALSQQRSSNGAGGASTPRAYQLAAAVTSPEAKNSNSNGKVSAPPPWAKTNKSAANNSTTSTLAVETSSPTAGSKNSNNTIEAQVLQSNPILESFGNARTVRNDNSSRFGKFIEIQFTNTGRLIGAHIATYLLEKVRLIQQCPGERNYHIFYELLNSGLPQRELARYFLAPTATPDDFRLTASGTHGRRDGVRDRDTYSNLMSACHAMGFDSSITSSIMSVTAFVLHASNLTFVSSSSSADDGGEECMVEETNVHLQPVCALLGVTVSDLNQALCHCVLKAGGTTVQRSMNIKQAEAGLEALLKETYGALFSYLVIRINDHIAYNNGKSNNSSDDASNSDEDDSLNLNTTSNSNNNTRHTRQHESVAATIGVLDIFGFESFATNSFEQLCINYCNEALQQQFNAFVLKNEQREYEREGIEWSFIEFPENQDVLDLMEKRGSGVLSILDDQCRAPGPSDKAFCLAVYGTCGTLSRFSATRKQQASLQFSIHHYAGPVEYSVTGFTAKNKDELPKETVVLLKSSEFEFVRNLADVMESSHHETAASSSSSTATAVVDKTPKKFHRPDSSVGRATVGGQFRTQLKALRRTIDKTAPHYIRCLKPNDLLVPDHFDTAIVAEQLRCGGILEAVRVARAGFTQHYTHADFCRRYRTIAWREISNKKSGIGGKGALTPAAGGPSWQSPSTQRRSNVGYRHSYIAPSSAVYSTPTTQSKTLSNVPAKKSSARIDLSADEAKAMCKDLIKALYRKIQVQNAAVEVGKTAESALATYEPTTPIAKARTYTFDTPSKTPSWMSKGKSTISPGSSCIGSGHRKENTVNKAPAQKILVPTTPASSSWKRGGLTNTDYANVGIQMGETKVFLRHHAFEALERIRSMEQNRAATTLHSIFRRYLARIAYLPYRSAMRRARNQQRSLFDDDFKESKEQEFGDVDNSMNSSFQSAAHSFRINNGSGGAFASQSLVDKWSESQIRDALHNPVPRHQWGADFSLSDDTNFRWVLREGLWVKNYADELCNP